MGKIYSYEPIKPWTTQKHKTLEVQMFSHYDFLIWQYQKLEKEAELKDVSEMTKYHKHLEWLIERGEDRIPKLNCHHCRKEKVKFFYFERASRDVITFSRNNIYCQNCSKKFSLNLNNLREFRFRTLLEFKIFRSYNYWSELLPLYRYVFQLPSIINKEVAFNFFKEGDRPIIETRDAIPQKQPYLPRKIKTFQVFQENLFQ